MKQSKSIGIVARLLLLTSTIIWGSSFVILKNTLDSLPFCLILAIRFSIGAILLSAIFIKKLKIADRAYLWQGAIIGLFLFLAYFTQTIGLEHTTPGKNAFLTAIYCVIVPFLFWLTNKTRPDFYNISAAFLAIFGIGLVSLNESFSLNIGDALTLVGGFFYAAHIVAVAIFAKDKDIIVITILQFFFAAIYCWIYVLIGNQLVFDFSRPVVFSVLYLGIFATTVALLFQNIGQKYTSPSSASIILSLESVFGVLFSVIFYSEKLTFKEGFGFLLIFAAIIISETKLSF